METYETVKARVFATGRIPNGYFGDTVEVGFSLIGQRVVAVADCGYFNYGLPDVADETEALWILQNDKRHRATSVSPA